MSASKAHYLSICPQICSFNTAAALASHSTAATQFHTQHAARRSDRQDTHANHSGGG